MTRYIALPGGEWTPLDFFPQARPVRGTVAEAAEDADRIVRNENTIATVFKIVTVATYK